MDEEIQNLTKKQRREKKREDKLKKRSELVKQQKNKTIITWSIVGIVLLLTVVGLFFLSQTNKSNSDNSTIVDLDTVTDQDWTKGNADAKVTLLEYSDFECPACSNYATIVSKIVEKYKDNIQLVYRHFPLKYHKSAREAAKASEASGKQGKFFEMHDLLFNTQSTWSDGRGDLKLFTSYAEKLNLDIEKFKTDYNSKEISAKIDRDYKSGLKAKVNAIPSFYINNKKVDSSNYGQLEQLIEQEINK